MWTCPKCGREFEHTGQDHYCASAPATIDEYILQAPAERRDELNRVRETIRAAAPEAVEKISWRMPTFWQGENLIHFAVLKNHLGLYPGDEGVRAFAERFEIEGYRFSKGAVQLPWSRPMPYELIGEITRYRVMRAQEKKGK